MRTDLSADHLCWDGTEGVTLEVTKRTAPDLVPVAVAKRRAVRASQRSPSGGVYAGYELRWLLPARETAGVTPKPGDVIEDDQAERWTVLTVEANRLRQTFACGCVNLVLALDLRDTVVIERASIAPDAAGVPVKSFPPAGGRDLYVVAARVQEVTREVAEERGVRYAKERYEVTVDRQLRDLDAGEDRLRWVDPAGVTRYLDIVDYRNPERIDELPVLTAEDRG